MSNVTTQGAGAVGPVDGRTPDPPTLRTVHYTHLDARAKTKCISEMRLIQRSANKKNMYCAYCGCVHFWINAFVWTV